MKVRIIVILAFLLSACSVNANKSTPTEIPCSQQARMYLDQVDDLLIEWTDALEIADKTPGMSIGPAIADLQEIRRKGIKLEYPECAIMAQIRMIEYMDKTIDGFLAFMSDESEKKITSIFEESLDLQEKMILELANIETDFSRDPTRTPTIYSVNYKVDGTAATVSLMYLIGKSANVEELDFSGIWQKSCNMVEGERTSIVAQNKTGAGRISCFLEIDGKMMVSDSSDKPYGTATCSFELK